MPERQYHYVKHNATTRMPRRHIFMDTEARSRRTGHGHVQSWRLAVANFTAAEKGRKPSAVTRAFRDPQALWEAVSEHCRPRSRTVLWAHSLGYDVRISEAFEILPRLGWHLIGHNLVNRGTWLQWRRDGTSLLMVDSMSVFPVSLAQVGAWFGLGKPDLPSFEDSDEEWLRRCHADVEILSTAITAYLGWLEAEDLGNWQLTGAGQAYAAFRHRFMDHQLLVHADADALAAERRALWAGRCEAYWHGRTGYVGVEEWDGYLAYPRIARDTLLPVRLLGRPANLGRLEKWLDAPTLGVLATVDVDTPVPVLPTHHNDRIVWPTGRFRTTVWDPEIRAALAAGATITPVRAWLYRREPTLAQWGAWIVDQLHAHAATLEPWKATVLKHWSRALIGRFGMTYQAWEPFAFPEQLAVRQCPIYNLQTGVETQITQVGGDMLISAGTQEWDQSMPAITGYVASVARVQLWDALQAMGPRSVLYADTDSILITSEHHDQAAAVARALPTMGMRLKSSWQGVEILGPRQVITDDHVRVAGVPKSAQRLPAGDLVGEVWASLAGSLRAGTPSIVDIRDRRWKLRGVDRRRDPGPDGWTVPIHVDTGSTT
jgi:hypothetical protein